MIHLVVGAGVVGQATGIYLEAHGEDVIYHDTNNETVVKLQRQGKNATEVMPSEWDICWMCTHEKRLPDIIPSRPSTKSTIVIRSTVEPDFFDNVDTEYILHMPEFLRENTALEDVFNPDRIIIGGESNDHTTKLAELMNDISVGVPIIIVPQKVSALIKLISNAYLSTQISFWNEIYDLLGNYKEYRQLVANIVTLDKRVSKYGTIMIGKPFGGTCVLPSAKLRTYSGNIYTIERVYRFRQKRYDHIKMFVESCTSDLREINYKEIKSVTKREIDEYIYEFETEKGILTCTSDHLIPVIRHGSIILVKAKDINEDDILFAKEGVRCKICGNIYTPIGLGLHLQPNHNITPNDYYDKYIKTPNEEICNNPLCSNGTNFIGINKGYHKYCSTSCASRDLWDNYPDYAQNVISGVLTAKSTPESTEKLKKSMKGINKGNKNPMKRPEVAKKLSDFKKEFFKDKANRDSMSIKIVNAWATGKFDGVRVGQCKWYDYKHTNGNIYKVQGTWELAFIKWLDKCNMEFTCHRGRVPYALNGRQRNYYPDFFVYDWDSYVDVKCKHFYKKEKFDAITNSNPELNFKILFRKDLEKIGVDISGKSKD